MRCRQYTALSSGRRLAALCLLPTAYSLMRILNAAQMREADRYTIEEIGIPSLVLM